MAEHNISAGDIAAHDVELVANTVETFTFARNVQTIEIISNGAAAAYYTLDGTTPTVGGSNTRIIPAGALSVDERSMGRSVDVIKIVSAGTPKISIQVS